MLDNLIRPIIGIENRTAQEVFDIMSDRIRSSLLPPSTGAQAGSASTPAEALPSQSGAEDLLRECLDIMNGLAKDVDACGWLADDLHGPSICTRLRTRLEGCECDACSTGVQHASDCAVHNGPALPSSPCDCGAALAKPASEPAGGGVLENEVRAALAPWWKQVCEFNKMPGIPASVAGDELVKIVLSLSSPASSSPAEVEALPDGVGLKAAWSFLQDRLLEFDQEIGGGEEEREWAGHVMPALSRFGSLIAALSPAPAQAGSQKDMSAHPRAIPTSLWQDIATAPKDGTRIDVWVRSTETAGAEYRQCGAYWNAVQGEWQLGLYHAGQFECRPNVTHWVPIPAPPSALEDSKPALADAPSNGSAPAGEER